MDKGAEQNTASLRAEGISKSFRSDGGEIRVLEDLDFEVAKGRSVAVVGASGIGKSTLLHILGTLERPDKGRLTIGGTDAFSLPDRRLADFRNRSVGFVFQFHHLLGEFSALENAAMPARIAGMKPAEARERAAVLLERVGLADRRKHRPGELSGGEQQRVAVARALVMEPAVLLADEPTGNLDVKTGERIHELLASLNEERGMALVVVTHNPALADRMQATVTLSEGKLVPVSES